MAQWHYLGPFRSRMGMISVSAAGSSVTLFAFGVNASKAGTPGSRRIVLHSFGALCGDSHLGLPKEKPVVRFPISFLRVELKLYRSTNHPTTRFAFSKDTGWVMFPAEPGGWERREAARGMEPTRRPRGSDPSRVQHRHSRRTRREASPQSNGHCAQGRGMRLRRGLGAHREHHGLPVADAG
jgi:hypothetical protein